MADDKKQTEEKAKADAQAAVETAAARKGAEAVAEAVKRVADQAVEAAKVQAVKSSFEFLITGSPGGRFEIRGLGNPHGFGANGTVLIGGKGQQTFEWGNDYIRGRLDADVKSGEVVVWVDPETKRTGYLNVGGTLPSVALPNQTHGGPGVLPAPTAPSGSVMK